jgi:glycosyltransferase involved in cell wall biosynthesis
MEPTVSINLCCYNSERFLRETLDSVAAQTYRDWELVVINDGSRDATESIIEDFMRAGHPVTYHCQTNQGLGASRNRALALSKGRYIAFLDHDDLWFPKKLEKQAALLDHRPEIDFVYTNFYNMKNDRLSLAFHDSQPEGFVFDRFLCHYPVGLLTVMARKKAVDQLDHPFDVSLKLLEELDLFMRLLYRSQAAYLSEPLATYRIHAGMSSKVLMAQYPVEWAYLLEKFRQIMHFFDQSYPAGANRICAQGAFCRAKMSMMDGDTKSARKHLRPYKGLDSNFFLFYLMTFFPVKIWDLSNKVRSRFQ